MGSTKSTGTRISWGGNQSSIRIAAAKMILKSILYPGTCNVVISLSIGCVRSGGKLGGGVVYGGVGVTIVPFGQVLELLLK